MVVVEPHMNISVEMRMNKMMKETIKAIEVRLQKLNQGNQEKSRTIKMKKMRIVSIAKVEKGKVKGRES